MLADLSVLICGLSKSVDLEAFCLLTFQCLDNLREVVAWSR